MAFYWRQEEALEVTKKWFERVSGAYPFCIFLHFYAVFTLWYYYFFIHNHVWDVGWKQKQLCGL